MVKITPLACRTEQIYQGVDRSTDESPAPPAFLESLTPVGNRTSVSTLRIKQATEPFYPQTTEINLKQWFFPKTSTII